MPTTRAASFCPAIEPGEYRLLVGPGLASGLAYVNGRTEFAEVPLTIATDMPDVVVVTQPGIGLAGQVVFAEGPPASPPKMRIAFRRPETSPPSSREIVATMDDEFRFYGSDVFGPQLVRVTELPAGWTVKAVTLAGTDITDVPTVFKQEHDGQLQVVLSSKASTLEGAVRGEGTSPPGEATVYVFGEDRSAWRMSSPRTHKSDAGENGKFSVARAGGWPLLRHRRGSRGISSGRESRGSVLRSAEQGGDAVRHRRRRAAHAGVAALALAGMSDLRTIVFGLLCSLLSQGQLRDQPARRDQPPAGAVSISGRVQAAGTGAPIQGAVIVLVTAPLMESHSSGRDLEGARIDGRTATTDASGGFSFTGVAPGAYRLIVSPAFHQGRYLPSGHGASRPNDPGRAFTVRAGEDIRDLTLTLPAGVAIEGRVMDEAGEPLSRMNVIAARVMAGSDVAQRVGHEPATTDDLGRYRIYGLEPGEYVVAVEGRSVPVTRAQQPGVRVPLSEQELMAFLTTFHPSALVEPAAQRIQLAPGRDAVGIDIAAVRARRFRVSGVVLDSQGVPLAVGERGPQPRRHDQRDLAGVHQLTPSAASRSRRSNPASTRWSWAVEGGPVLSARPDDPSTPSCP